MKFLTVVDKKKIVIKEKEMPKATSGRVLIKVLKAGICGGDWHMIWANGVKAGLDAAAGHEFSGIVLDPSDTKFKVGDRVTAIEYSPCMKSDCEYCSTHRYHLCPDRFKSGIGLGFDGAFGEYITAREDMVYLLPDSISDKQGAMIEPCSVGMHGVKLAGVKEGSTVLITGAGAIGLFAAACAKALGAKTVAITEANQIRLLNAKEASFIDYAFDAKESEIKEKLSTIAGGQFDAAIECSGNKIAATMALDLIKPGSTLTLLAYGPGPDVDLFSFINNEKRIQGAVFFTPEDFKLVIEMMADGRINIEKYGEIIRMDKAQETLEGLDNGTMCATKYIIDMAKG